MCESTPLNYHSITLLVLFHILIDYPSQRRDVLREKGKIATLIDDLLEDAEKWAQFRSILQNQVEEARKFRTIYTDLNYEDDQADDGALDYLEKTIDSFAKTVSSKISQLDQASQSLIQIVSVPTNSDVSRMFIMLDSKISYTAETFF